MGALPPGLSARPAARSVAAAALAVIAACTDATGARDDDRPGPAASLERLAPDSFTVAPGDTTPLEVGVRVLDARGRPVPGVEVRWEPSFYVAPARLNADVNGEARATWRPPPLAVARRPEPLSAVVGAGGAERRVAFVALVREKVIFFGTVIRADTLPRNTGVVLEVGQSARYITYGRGPNDTIVADVPARWSSRDTARATVDQSGVVTARAQGAVRIDAAIPVANPTPWTTVLVVDPLRARDVAAGRRVTCALLPDGRAACWGDRFTGVRQSRDAIVEPAIVAPGLRFAALRAGERFTCGLTPEGRAHCWGGTYLDAVGFGEGWVGTLRPALADLRLVSVTVGWGHVCGVDAAGAVHCALISTTGRVGTFVGATVRIALPAPARVLAASGQRACAAVGDDVYCWHPRLIVDGSPDFTPAVRVVAGAGATDLELSGSRLCMLDVARRARCTTVEGDAASATWTAPLGDVTLTRLAVGPYTVCGIDTAAALRCAGTNYAALLMARPGAEPSTLVDARAPDGTGWARVSLGDYTSTTAEPPFADPHACGVTVGGRTYCWGAQSAGQLGSPSEVTCVTRAPYLPCSPTPLPVPSVRG